MDGSAVRRGARTAHLAYGDRHADGGWRGEARRFGEGVAILLGDLAHVYADRLLPRAHPDVQAVWDELRTELNVGQYLDLLGTARGDVDHDARPPHRPLQVRQVHDRAAAARRAPRWPAGSPTWPARCPPTATRSARPSSSATTCSARSATRPLTGKPVGDDLREGKPTPLLAARHRRPPTPRQAEVLALVGQPDLDRATAIAGRPAVLVATGAVAAIEASIDAPHRRRPSPRSTARPTDHRRGPGRRARRPRPLRRLARTVPRVAPGAERCGERRRQSTAAKRARASATGTR